MPGNSHETPFASVAQEAEWLDTRHLAQHILDTVGTDTVKEASWSSDELERHFKLSSRVELDEETGDNIVCYWIEAEPYLRDRPTITYGFDRVYADISYGVVRGGRANLPMYDSETDPTVFAWLERDIKLFLQTAPVDRDKASRSELWAKTFAEITQQLEADNTNPLNKRSTNG